MDIGERIRNRRLELGLTQDEVAQKTGYKSRSSINKIECSRNLPLSKVEKMAKALECAPSFLMGWEDEELMIEVIKDNALSGMSERMKEYAIRLSKLSEQQQEGVFNMIDLFFKKDGKE